MAASDEIRQGVNNLRSQSGGQQRVAQQFNNSNQPAQQKYKPFIEAATRWKQNPASISDTDKNSLVAAAIIIAQKRGIATDSNGNYPKEEVEKSLENPDKMLKQLAAHCLNDAQNAVAADQKDQAIEDARNEMITTVQNAGGNSETVTIVQQARPYTSDETLIDMDPETYAQATADMDPADVERINNLRRESDEERKKAAGRIKANMRDPDWGHKKDDDDFKIEQGDIIEYLMKEVILASAAWVGNKTAGLVGSVVYEIGGTAFKKALPRLRDTKTAIARGWDQIFDKGPSHESMVRNCNENIGNLEENLNELERKPRNLDNLEKIKVALLYHTKTIDDIIAANPSLDPKRNELQNLQKIYDSRQVDIMLKNMGADENDENQRQGIENWLNQLNRVQEDCARNGTTFTTDLIPEPKSNFNKLMKTRDELATDLAFSVERNLLQAQTELFAETYLKYRLEQENRNNPQNTIFSDKTESKKFVEEEKLIATHIFLSAEQARRQGQTELNGTALLSREGMIEAMKKLADKAKTENVEDTQFKPLISGQTTTKETVETLYDAAKKPDPAEIYNAEKNNLDMQIREAETHVAQTDQQRNQLNALKNRLNNKKVNINNKYNTLTQNNNQSMPRSNQGNSQ